MSIHLHRIAFTEKFRLVVLLVTQSAVVCPSQLFHVYVYFLVSRRRLRLRIDTICSLGTLCSELYRESPVSTQLCVRWNRFIDRLMGTTLLSRKNRTAVLYSSGLRLPSFNDNFLYITIQQRTEKNQTYQRFRKQLFCIIVMPKG